MEHAAAAIVEFLDLAQKLPADTLISVPAHIVFAVIDGYKLASRNKKRAASLVKHTCDLMAPIVRAATSHAKEELGASLVDELDALPQLLKEVQAGMLQITGRGTFTRFTKRGEDQQLIEDLNAKLVQRLREFEMKGILNIQIRQNTNHTETRELLQQNRSEMHTRFDQLQATTAVNTTRARAYPLRQAVSPHFTGRDDLVVTAVAAITGSSRPHLSFFGTGGIGKTSMSLAVAHHESCVQHFCDYRYFIECELLTSASAVRSSILQALAGSSTAPSQGDPRQLLADMLSVDQLVLLILDNFETPWNTAGQRSELTELLKDMAAMPNVRLVTTLRSDGAPASADVMWTALPVRVLELDPARELFLAINSSTNRSEHEDLDRLLKEVDCLPLAVKLLAQVKKGQTCSELLQRWQDTQTSLVTTELQGGTRLTSLDVSISLSLHSPLVDDVTRKLLSTICLLPAGVIGGRRKLKAMDLGVPRLDARLDALLEVALLTDDRTIDRITIPPPIRAYVSGQEFVSYEEQLETYYISQIEGWNSLSMGATGYVDRLNALLAEVDNVRHFLEYRMMFHSSLKMGRVVFAFTYFEYLLRPSTRLITCLTSHLTHIGWEEQRPCCILRLADIYYKLSKYAEAEQELEAAQAQFVELGDRQGAAQCLQYLAEIHTQLDKYAKAEQELEAAQAQFVELGSRLGAAQCLRCLADVHRMLSKYAEAEDELEAAQAQFVELGDRLGAAQCLQSLADVHRIQSKYAEAEEELEAAQAQFVELGNRLGAAQCLQSLGDVHRMLSKFAEAEQELEAARAQFVELGFRLGVGQCLRFLADICRQQQRWQEAETLFAEAESIASSIDERFEQAWICRLRGRLYKAQARNDEARAQFARSRDMFFSIGLTTHAEEVMNEASDE